MPGRMKVACGAWAKARGRPCRAKAINGTGRCRVHGGTLRTPEGVRRATEGQAAYYARLRQHLGLPAWWRFKLVGMTATEWLAKQRAQQAQPEPGSERG